MLQSIRIDATTNTLHDRILRRIVGDYWIHSWYVRTTSLALQTTTTLFLYLSLTANDDTLISTIIEGVTIRLHLYGNDAIRKHGMVIGERIGALTKQPISFNELRTGTSVTAANTIEGYIGTDGSISNSDDDDDDTSVFDDDSLLPYNLHDDQEDIRATAKPRYLSECLDMLRRSTNDDDAQSQHQTALHALPDLVRSKPADLDILSTELARTVLRFEDAFSTADFDTCVQLCLTSLVASHPVAVGCDLIAELYRDGFLRDRMLIYHSLNTAALEMSGQDLLQDQRSLVLPNVTARVSGKHSMVTATNEEKTIVGKEIGSRTRRWGHGRHRLGSSSSKSNRFHSIAPTWFYALLNQFMECKDNEVIWGDEKGGKLLSGLLYTLANIVQCSCGSKSTTITSPQHQQQYMLLCNDLFQLAWTFRTATIANVRCAALYCVQAALENEHKEQYSILQHGTNVTTLIQYMRSTIENDSDDDCQTIARTILKGFTSSSSIVML